MFSIITFTEPSADEVSASKLGFNTEAMTTSTSPDASPRDAWSGFQFLASKAKEVAAGFVHTGGNVHEGYTCEGCNMVNEVQFMFI